ncbi:MAG TPA: molybdopterin-dependent oxidoreductase [Bryobacteraceae bacterium]
MTFQGVLLTDLLAKVTTPTGDEHRHTAASYYLVAEGRDGYRAVFAWAELDPSFTDKAVYVVTARDGKPLPESDGPFQLVVPGERRNARWVRQLSALRVEPNTTPFGSEPARWIRENLPELESIQAGMTRKDLLKVFMSEGGLSTRTWQRYVYRKCIYVKVDVEFAPVGPVTPRPAPVADSRAWDRTLDSLGESPDDRITKISKPYLELSIRD